VRLSGLSPAACEQLLASHALVGTPEVQARLIARYEGKRVQWNSSVGITKCEPERLFALKPARRIAFITTIINRSSEHTYSEAVC
jgi:hypothetical protein